MRGRTNLKTALIMAVCLLGLFSKTTFGALIIHYPLDEGTGMTAGDASGNDNDGTLMGPVWVDSLCGYGTALRFNGLNDYVAIQNFSYVNASGLPEVSVCAWIRTSDSSDQIISSYDRNEYWRFEINGNGAGPGQVGWDVYTSTGQVDYGSSSRVDDGQWHHVAAVFDNGTLTIYIDAKAEESASGGTTFGRGAATRYGFVGVGSEASSFDGDKTPYYFKGDLDEVQIYNHALSPAEIQSLAARYDAHNPSPANRATNVDPCESVACSWTPGIHAATHDVYFGTSLSDVNESATPIISGLPLDVNYYDPGPLEWGTTYYWRIDEVNGTDVWQGNVWSFSTPPDFVVPADSPEGKMGLMGIREVIDNGTINNQDDCYNSLNSGTGTIVDYRAPVLNIRDSGWWGHFFHYDLFGVVTAGHRTIGTVDNLSLVAKGTIQILSGGDYTFCVSSDDGFTLQFPGHDFTGISGDGDIAVFGNGNALRNWGGRTISDTLGIIYLPAGDHPFVLTYDEGHSGAAVEFSAAQGVKTQFDFNFQLIGHRSVGAVPVPGLVGTVYVEASEPSAWSGGQVDSLQDASDALSEGPISSGYYQFVNFNDPMGQAGPVDGGWIPGDVIFPNDSYKTNDDDFGVRVTGTIDIPANGTYHIGYNSDDGASLQIIGQPWIRIFVDGTGNAVIDYDKLINDSLTGWSFTVGEIELLAGEYDFEMIMLERGGDARLELFGRGYGDTGWDPSWYLLRTGGASSSQDSNGLQLVGPEPEPIFVDEDATGGANNGTSWADAYLYLKDALDTAVYGDQILVAEGTYTPDANGANPGGTGDRTATFQLKKGVSIFGSYAGYGEPDPNARDYELYETVLSGDIGTLNVNTDNSYHVVTGSGTDVTAVLDGFTITGGNANGLSYPDYLGGGMYNNGGSPTISNCIFSVNVSEGEGGGMYNWNYSNPTVTNCTFSGNLADYGGGMYNYESDPAVTNCNFSGNSAALSGGGMRNSDSNPAVVNCTFSGNSAVGIFGGGMFNTNSRPTLTNCTLSGNSADNDGGGMYNHDSNPTVTNCILWGNSAPTGPEIHNSGTSSPTVSYSCIEDEDPDDGSIYPGTGNIDDNPVFVDANGADNIVGTEDDNLRLWFGSPCIDAGDNDAVPLGVTTDLDGNPRFVDDPNTPDTGNGTPPIVDMGAYEGGYAVEQRTLTISSTVGGSVTTPGEGIFEYEYGEVVSIVAQPSAHYHFVEWTGTAVDAGKVANPTAASTSVTMEADYTLVANFAIDQHTLNISSTPGGTVTTPGEGIFEYEYGEVVPIVADADAHYHFVEWTGTAVDAGKVANPTAASTTVTMHDDYTLVAVFTIDQHTLTVSSTAGGSVTTPGEGTFEYIYGEVVSIFADANTGYRFVEWTGTAVDAGKVANPTAESTTLTMHIDCNLVANFRSSGPVYVDADANGVNDGTSWADAYNYLQDALDAAIHGDQILVAQGAYKPDANSANPSGTGERTATFQLIDNVKLYGGYAGFGEPNSNARDVDLYETILSGDIGILGLNFDNSKRVVTSIGMDATAVLDGFTITGGIADINGGGGMYNKNSSPTVNNCTFSGNSTNYGGCGGGMYNHNSDPNITNCTFSGNSADSDGGGMYNLNSDPNITNCTFSGNPADNDGGGMYNENSSPTVNNCTFSGNMTEYDGRGGGMYNKSSDPTVTKCTFSGNTADFDGGGMYNYKSSPTLTNCTFSSNTADYYGGGMYNYDYYSNPTVTNCTFYGNSANSGGGMYNEYESSPTVTNCIFSGNSADDWGGGMYTCTETVLSVTNCTFISNSADYSGGGMFNDSYDFYGIVNVTNCILWNNIPDEIEYMNEVSVVYCDVKGGWPGTGNIDIDPLFVDANGPDDIAGTEDDNLRLSADSNCIDAGDNTAVPPDIADLDNDANTTEPTPLDLDGNPRFVDDPHTPDTGNGTPPIVDMGAYEYYREPVRIYVDADATGGANNGTSWPDAYLYLQDALDDAVHSDQILVAEGTYTPDTNSANPGGTGEREATFQLIDSIAIYGGYAGFGEPDPDERDIELYKTTLSGDLAGNDEPNFGNYDENAHHVVAADYSVGINTTLDGLIITAGNCDLPWQQGGGGIYNFGDLTMRNCTFIDNLAKYGGALFSNYTILDNCTFVNNSAVTTGGAIYVWYHVEAVNCVFLSNSASDYYGGAVSVDEEGGGDGSFTNCLFSGNWSDYGGAISCGGDFYFDLYGCTLSGNQAANAGGGLYVYEDEVWYMQGYAYLYNCILWGNSAPAGAQIALNDGYASASHCDVEGGWPGTGNIDIDPLFVDADGPDDIAGTEDDNLRLSLDSPCIDTGDNNSVPPDTADLDNDANTTEPTPYDLDGHDRIVDGDCNDTEIVDMGAYEFSWAYIGDLYGGCDVDFKDFAVFALAWWTEDGEGQYSPACDISLPADNYIDWLDLMILSDNWLAGR